MQLPPKTAVDGTQVNKAGIVLVDNYGTIMIAETELVVKKIYGE